MFMTIASFLIVTGIVAFISWKRTKNDDLSTSKGYFLAGRGLSGLVIGCSMVLTSLSTEQLIGVNAVSYKGNFSIIAWTVQSVIPLCFLALYLLPKYLRNGYTTIPEFFENRFDRQTRLIMSALFLVFYLFIVIPTALYTGAIAFNKIFNLEVIFGLSYGEAIVYTVIAIGVVGAIYAIFGGLKAVAVSDTINAIILVIGALLIPIFALVHLGDGSFSDGVKTITTTHVEKFNAIGNATDAVPWPAIFTGILIVNFFYWTTNQAIVQRALGARDLQSGQKGILVAALFLLTLPIILNLPGLLSFHIFGDTLNPMDTSYPVLVSKVLPTFLQGFFIAALFGAILSTFNSFLNSAATIYCKDLLPSLSAKVRSDKELISYAKKVSAVMAILTMIIGPLLMFGTDGIFLLTKRFAGFVNIPIVALFAVGLFNKTVSGLAARIALLLHVILYFSIVWVFNVQINFVYVMAALFVFDVVTMLILGQFLKREPYQESKENHSDVDLTNWKYVRVTVASLVLGLISLHLLLSPLGLASQNGQPLLVLGIYAVLQFVLLIVMRHKQEA
ncbi:solute:sodium symporter family transporter [Testudinibacter aquarius]|uniref:SSS family solute:Na+ symporter n=1 Tax=Testudinibacter aquarius TaxID=1524974 RepID=A0A4R3YCB3_9PAST|nr:solute:sodium symporter family transporter [Testudinibacter aquarius]TNG93607.1 solute:sodium symporter family transporter [Pasteurellaceae bacterium UScroc12]TNG94679.1 solute:sodium symporter family transporter [Pasteurellaceae bacterium USgator41]TNG95279.1 solute:sodium symporter family transporter [Pasteurellaceae bacterium UScroc31]TNH00820.1 solute:sodium symporter family transporter [Pasteurellaceae bacterium USgator11]KAE9529313.1 solute:sodium symporter family transporter [Testudi